MKNTRNLLACAALGLALAACQKPAEENVSTVPEATPEAAAQAADNAASHAPAAAEAATLAAGTFKGTLPCASCPGIDAELTLNADGSYLLKETYQEQADGHFESRGTWAVANGELSLTAEKADDNRRYAIDSADALTQLDTEGKRPQGELNYTITRAP